MKAILRTIRISPKKANLVAGMVRGKKVNEALPLLKFMPKKGADILYKVVLSAASNAKNNFKQNIDDLYITRLLVTKGPTYRRSLPISRGRVHPIDKRTSHITVEVGELGGKKPAKSEASVEAEASVKKETKKTVTAPEKAKKKGAARKEIKKSAKKTKKTKANEAK
jgi:large subunit ribosomal protein L22